MYLLSASHSELDHTEHGTGGLQECLIEVWTVMLRVMVHMPSKK